MAFTQQGLNLVAWLMHRIPARTRGKIRVAKFASTLLSQSSSASKIFSIRHRENLTLFVPSIKEPIALHLLANGMYEPQEQRLLRLGLACGGDAVDIGANIGAHALPLAAANPTARVLCVEPSPMVLECLNRGVRENQLSNVLIEPVMCGETTGMQILNQMPPSRFGMSGALPYPETTPLPCPMVPLDDLVQKHNLRVKVIKIDVEGFEWMVLKGATNTIEEHRPWLVFEFADWSVVNAEISDPAAAQKLLMDLDYCLLRLAPNNQMHEMKTVLSEGSASIFAVPKESLAEFKALWDR